MQTIRTDDAWTWCPKCREFRPGIGPCPVCADPRNGYEPVRVGLYDRKQQYVSDPGYQRK